MGKKDESKNYVVLGIFNDQAHVEVAIDRLKAHGFRNSDVSALLPTGSSNKEFAHIKETKLPEGTSTGATSGMVLGGTLGWLAGVGSLAIPGVGPFIAAGPIMGMLAGIGVGGAVGGLAGALIGIGIPEFEAKRFEGQVKDGGILLSVHCDNSEWCDKAEALFEELGAKDVTSTSEADADYAESTKPYTRSTI